MGSCRAKKSSSIPNMAVEPLMTATLDTYNRIGKLFVDRDQLLPELAQEKLGRLRVRVACGPNVGESITLRVALLTAANIASRCLPGGLTVSWHSAAGDSEVSIPWPIRCSLKEAVATVAPNVVFDNSSVGDGSVPVVVFGDAPTPAGSVRATFDGWSLLVGPSEYTPRLDETDRCSLVGVALGALAIAEVFFRLANVNVESTCRQVGFSLWRPDLHWGSVEGRALDMRLRFLPNELWALGLGHLGQSYLWALGFLPFSDPGHVLLVLNDHDRIVPANHDTGLLTFGKQVGLRKTRVALRWLEGLGFDPNLVERRFDEGTKVQPDEPHVALGGFDGSGPRHLLSDSGFCYIVDAGLGGTASNFDCITIRTLPHPSVTSRELWPADVFRQQHEERTKQLAAENEAYAELGRRMACGHVELAGCSIAVPFVGGIAAALVLSEVCRSLHQGERYEVLHLSLAGPEMIAARRMEDGYRDSNSPRFRYQHARQL
jgi:hypothetical protein